MFSILRLWECVLRQGLVVVSCGKTVVQPIRTLILSERIESFLKDNVRHRSTTIHILVLFVNILFTIVGVIPTCYFHIFSSKSNTSNTVHCYKKIVSNISLNFYFLTFCKVLIFVIKKFSVWYRFYVRLYLHISCLDFISIVW